MTLQGNTRRMEANWQYCWHPLHRALTKIDYFTKRELAVMRFPMCEECGNKSDATERELNDFGRDQQMRGQL